MESEFALHETLSGQSVSSLDATAINVKLKQQRYNGVHPSVQDERSQNQEHFLKTDHDPKTSGGEGGIMTPLTLGSIWPVEPGLTLWLYHVIIM